LTLALAALMLLPGTGRLGNRAVWQSKQSQAEFTRWAASLRDMGYRIDARSLESELWQLTRWYVSWRRPLERAMSAARSQLGIDQGWAMFSNPQTRPARLHVDIDRGSGWEPLYVSRSDEHAWQRERLDNSRLRKWVGRIARGGSAPSYARLVAWIGNLARSDFPEAKRVRVRLQRFRSEPPGSHPLRTRDRFEDERLLTWERTE
jgi:hypothetical protein